MYGKKRIDPTGGHMRFVLLPCALAVAFAAAGCHGDSATSPQRTERPPSLTAQVDTSCAIGDTLRLQAVATDPDGDALRYSASVEITFEEFTAGYLVNGGMNEQTGRFSFIPSQLDKPGRRVSFYVDDGRGGRDSTSFQVSVRSTPAAGAGLSPWEPVLSVGEGSFLTHGTNRLRQ